MSVFPETNAEIAILVQAESNYAKLLDSEAAKAVAPVQAALDSANAEIAQLKTDIADSDAARKEALDKLTTASTTAVAAPASKDAPVDAPVQPVSGATDPVTGQPVA